MGGDEIQDVDSVYFVNPPYRKHVVDLLYHISTQFRIVRGEQRTKKKLHSKVTEKQTLDPAIATNKTMDE